MISKSENVITSKTKQRLIISTHFLIPLIFSIIYWFEEPVWFSFESGKWVTNLLHNFASILGIFSFIWMCLNIIIMLKIKAIENNINLEWLLKFHKQMSIIALLFGVVHGVILMLTGTFLDTQVVTGTIGLLLFIALMVLAVIFMTNSFIGSEKIKNLRASAYKKNFKYNANKVLHNITMLVVFIIFIHTLISFTAISSIIMRVVYFSFFVITFMGWVRHKLVRKLGLEPDPYLHRKSSWDILNEEFLPKGIDDWALKIIEEHPSIYPCIQCGSCTVICPVSNITNGGYNPRELIESLLLGLKDRHLVDKGPNVWQCTQCYSCFENCPQHVDLPEIFISLRNNLAERKEAPKEFLAEAKAVYNYGLAIPLQNAITKRRKLLGLPAIPQPNVQEIQEIMILAGFKELITKDEIER